MSEFVTQIKATLDLGDAEAKLNSFMNGNHKIKVDVDSSAFNKLNMNSGNFAKAGQQAGQSFSNALSKQVKSVETSMNNFKFDSVVAKMNSQMSKFAGQDNSWLTEAKRAMQEYQAAFDTLKSKQSDGKLIDIDDEQVVASFNKMTQASEQFKNAMAIVNTETSKTASSSAKLTAANQITTWANNNTKALKDYGSQLDELAVKAKNATTVGELQNIKQEFKQIQTEASSLGKTGNSWTSEFSRAFSQIGQFVGIYGVLQQGTQVAKQMVSEVINVDSALVELSKVSDVPLENLSGQFENATATAKELGATISDVINSTADWKRLGFTLDQSEELARVTSLFQTVGDNMTQESASESLISTLKGFEMDASEALSIVDKINEVSNTQPIDTAGIADALQRSASSMSAAGNTIEETIGLITAANSVVQDPDSVGEWLADIA